MAPVFNKVSYGVTRGYSELLSRTTDAKRRGFGKTFSQTKAGYGVRYGCMVKVAGGGNRRVYLNLNSGAKNWGSRGDANAICKTAEPAGIFPICKEHKGTAGTAVPCSKNPFDLGISDQARDCSWRFTSYHVGLHTCMLFSVIFSQTFSVKKGCL